MSLLDPSEYCNSKQAANYLGVSEQTQRKSRVTGILLGFPAPPYVKLNNRVYYCKSELETFKQKVLERTGVTYQNTAQERAARSGAA